MKYHYHSFPVMDNGSLVGIVSLHNVRELDRDAWPRTSVAEITYRDVVNLSMHKDDDVMDAMARMARFDVGRLPVVEDGRMVGIVTRRDIIQILSVKTDLGE
jgi:predicted transcriptional regulator